MDRIINFTLTALFLIPPIVYYLRLQLRGQFISVGRIDYDSIMSTLWVVPFIIQTNMGFATIIHNLDFAILLIIVLPFSIFVYLSFSYKEGARPTLYTKYIEKDNLLKAIERTLSEMELEFNRQDNEIVLSGDENISFSVANYPFSKCVAYVYNYEELPEKDLFMENIKSRLEERSERNSQTMVMPLSMIVLTIAFLVATLFGYLPLNF